MGPRPITLHGKPLGPRMPAICAPLVGRTREALLAEASAVAAKEPDLLEWRADFFEHIADAKSAADLLGQIKQAAGGLPLLFTCRSSREGGEKIALSEAQIVQLYRAVCESRHAAFVDYEMSNEAGHVRQVREFSRACGVQLIASFHDFKKTPAQGELTRQFEQAEAIGADVAKVAVMPASMDDVLVLLAATLQSSRERAIPLISMAMAGQGAITRACGWAFGSALTFAVGQAASAPGQMPIDDLRQAIGLLRKAS